MGGRVEVSGDQQRTIVERIEHIEEEIKELNASMLRSLERSSGCESKTRRRGRSMSPCSRFI